MPNDITAAFLPAFLPPDALADSPRNAVSHRGLIFAAVDGYRPLELDLYVPEDVSAPAPLVVWIHGGAWIFGARSQPPGDWDANLVFQSAIDAGIAVATIDYRHSREAPFPAQLHDSKAALRYLRMFAPQLGIDPDRIAVWGESAGGHLAALLALVNNPELEGDIGATGVPSHVSAAVCFYPITDAATMPSFSESLTDGVRLPSPIEMILEGSPWAYQEGLSRMSPVSYVRSDAPPMLLIHGDADQMVPVSQSQQLARALEEVNGDVRLITVPGAHHCFYADNPETHVGTAMEFLAEALQKPSQTMGTHNK
jgi:acetyl esterase/lipase